MSGQGRIGAEHMRAELAALSCVRVGLCAGGGGGNINVGLGVGLQKTVLSDTHECLCEYVEQKTKTSQIFEIIGHLI